MLGFKVNELGKDNSGWRGNMAKLNQSSYAHFFFFFFITCLEGFVLFLFFFKQTVNSESVLSSGSVGLIEKTLQKF